MLTFIVILIWIIGAIITCITFSYFCEPGEYRHEEDASDKVIVAWAVSMSWPIVIPAFLIFVGMASITQALVKLGENLRSKK